MNFRFRILFLCLAIVGGSTHAWAQDDASDTSPNSPRGAVIQEQTKSFVVEGLGVAVLCGAALFAICRGSVRGR